MSGRDELVEGSAAYAGWLASIYARRGRAQQRLDQAELRERKRLSTDPAEWRFGGADAALRDPPPLEPDPPHRSAVEPRWPPGPSPLDPPPPSGVGHAQLLRELEPEFLLPAAPMEVGPRTRRPPSRASPADLQRLRRIEERRQGAGPQTAAAVALGLCWALLVGRWPGLLQDYGAWTLAPFAVAFVGVVVLMARSTPHEPPSVEI